MLDTEKSREQLLVELEALRARVTEILTPPSQYPDPLSFGVEQQMEGLAVLDAQGVYAYMNPAYARVYGYERSELIGTSWKVLYDPAVREVIERQHFPTLAATGQWRGEITGRKKSGKSFQVEVSLMLIRDYQGASTGLVCTCRDAGWDAQAKDKLRESERTLHTLVASLPGLAYRCKNDPEWTLEYISEQVRDLVGYAPADFLSKRVSWGQLIELDDRDRVWEEVQSAINAHQPYRLEYRLRPRAGDQIWVWEQGQAVYGPDGAVQALEGFVMAITDRKQAEQILRESEERLRRVLDALPVAAYTCDAAGLITYFNERATELWGREPQLNHPEDRFCGSFRLFRTDGTQIPHDQCWMAVAVTEGRTVNGKEIIIERADGTRRSALAHANPLWDSSGRQIGAVNVLLDISERKQADEVVAQSRRQYEELVNTVNGIVWEVDVRTMTFTFVSRRAEAMLGYPLEQWLTVANFWVDHIHPEDREWAPAFCLEETRKKSGHTFEYRMLAADGRTVWLRDIVSVIVEDDQPVMLRGVMVDITERKRAEEEIHQRLARQGALFRLTAALARAATLEEIYACALDTLLGPLPVDRASILLFDPDSVMRFRAWRGLSDAYRQAVEGHSPWTPDAADPQPIVVPDAEADPGLETFRPIILGEGIRALAFIPLMGGGRLLGKFMLYCNEPRLFCDDIMQFAQTVAHHVAFAIERKRAEEALRQSEERFRSLYDDNPSMYFTVSPDGTVLSVNRFGAQRLGHQADELIGGSVLTVVHGDDREAVRQGLAEAFAHPNRATSSEFRKVTKDGTVIWVRETVRVLPAAAAAAAGNGPVALIVCEDITERKLTEEAERKRTTLIRAQEESLIELAKNYAIHSGNLESAFRAITEVAARLLGVGRASIWLLDADRSAIRMADLYEVEQNRHSSGTLLWARDFPAYFQAIEGEERTVSAHEAHTDPRTKEFSASYLTPLGIGAMLDAPIGLKGETGGVLCHEHLGGPRIWTPDEDTIAASLATMVSLALEAHERKRAEAALQESHERLQQALEASQTGTWRVDLRTGLDTRDASLNRTLGYPPQSSTQPVDDWFTHVYPDDLAEMRAAWEQALVTGLYDVEHRLVRRDGLVLWVHDRGRLVRDEAGQPLYAVGAANDITARKRLEEEAARAQHFINSILEHIPHMIFVKDATNLRFARFNRAGEELVGFSREELIGKNDYDFFPKEEADFFTKKDREVLATRRLLEIPEEPIQTRSKGERLLRTKKIPLLNEKGEPEYLLGISEDITERKQLEQRLRQAEKMEAIGTLAGGIAHDFNNILAAMIGYTELSLDGVEPGSRARQNLDQVLVAGRRAKTLIQQILAFSRRRAPQREVISLDRLLQEVTTLLRASIPTTINMRIDLRGGESRVLADPTQLQQVIMNLCSNAAQAMQQTGGTLDLVLENLELASSFATAHPPLKPGPHVCLTVRDTGVGMDPEVLRRIFDPFFTTKKVGEGTGLGLSAALGIVTSHGGTITVQSERGRGSTFSVYLPQFTASSVGVDSTPAATRGGSERILFIDDEAALARLGEQMLGNLGYRVTALTDPVLALGQFRNAPDAFDLVITDQTMQGLTGDALTRELTRIRPELPVILCTGYSQGFSEQTAREIGISAFLMKPLEVAEMDQAIRRVLKPAPQ